MSIWFDKLIRKYYANAGFVNILTRSDKVKDLKIEGNVVNAKVLAGNKYEYCEIEFNEFDPDDVNKLNQLISKPFIMYQLSNNVFPEQLLDCGINIFPNNCDDFKVKCSCGKDFGDCKDVIHVLQVLSKRMLEDSFLIFNLRGFELKKEEFYHIKYIDEIFSHNFKKDYYDLFNHLSIISSSLLKNNDFGEGLEAIYNIVFKDLSQKLRDILQDDDYHEYIKFKHFKSPNFHKKNLLDLFKQKWNNPSCISFDIDSNYEMSRIEYIKNPHSLFAYLMEMSQFDDSNFDYNLRFSLDILRLTFSLIIEGAIVPQIFKLENDKFTVRWIPAFYIGNVLDECMQYYPDCPKDLITYKGKNISKENQVIILISLIIKGFIDYQIDRYGAYRFKSHFNDLIYQIFFDEPFEALSSHKQDLINQLAQKISVFEMNELDFQYYLTLKDSDEGMFLELEFKKGNKIKNLNEADFKQLSYVKNIYDLFTRFGIKNTLCEKILLTSDDYAIFKKHIKPLLKYINVKYEVSFDIHEVGLKLKLDLKMNNPNFSFNDIRDYEWKVIIGEDVISLDEFNRIYKYLDSLVKINSNYYTVDRHRLNVFQGDIIFLPRNLESNELLQISLLERYRNIKFEGDSTLKEMINISKIIDDPSQLNGKLRHYQKIGVSWLLQNIKSGFGSILADDMGLGKTIQVLACILYLKENNQLDNHQVLIIAPTTLLSNWESEIIKFTPSLTYSLYHGLNREFPQEKVDIILTSFGIVREDIEKFQSVSWFLCVVDEAQNIKNPNTKQTKSIKSISAFNKIALTGTPIENRLLDYWSIFDFTNKGYLFSRKDFKKKYVVPIENESHDNVLDNLKKITKPFILRRLKSDKDIINDLPEKNVNDIYCNLTEKQTKLYGQAMDNIFNKIENSEGIDRKGLILKLITHLKQICNHPSQYAKSKNPKVGESGKLQLLISLLENILDNGEKVIIFTQYVKMGEILEKLILKNFNREVLFLHGSLSRSAREKILNNFQNVSAYPILIATLKTGGVGLNLTAAQNVIHYDLWWNPAVENQATDRVYRIGQKKDVMIYRLITKGTLEENIDLIIKNKLELAGKAIDSQETFITEMSDKELIELLSLR